MSICFTDTETRSRVPIQAGTDLYTRACECFIVTWALDNGPIQIWDRTSDPGIPAELVRIVADETITLVAHNAQFDRNVFLHALGCYTAPERWHCTMAQAYSHGLPGSLELLGHVLGLGDDKQKLVEDGKLIHLFCMPLAASGRYVEPAERPAEWARFKGYAIRDTEVLREIFKKLPTHNYQDENFLLWALDQKINARGFQFDTKLARAAVDFLQLVKERGDVNMNTATDGAVQAATQRGKLLTYLQRQLGVDIPNLKAPEIRAMLESDDISREVRTLLEMRLEGAQSSGSKYMRGLRMVGPGDRMRFTLQFNGAGRTGRESGRGFQPHNMKRPTVTVRRPDGSMELVPVKAKFVDEVIIPGIYSKEALNNELVYGNSNEAASLALRHVITAAPGNELVVGDWSNIESRVLAWVADETWKLDAYRAVDRGEGVDLYKLLFSQFFGTAVEDVNDTERQSGKVSELAFGFGGGVGALVTMSAGYQMDLEPLAELVLPRATDEQLKKATTAWRRAFLKGEDYELEADVYKACDILKQTYREANTKINDLRHAVDDATKTAVKEPGRAFDVGRCRIWSTGTWLIIQLPSGRRLLYANPRVELELDLNPDTMKERLREYISYASVRGKSWIRERSWNGLFIENMVQAIANDVLRGSLLRIDSDAWTVPDVAKYLESLPPEEQTAVSLHVHDELCLDVPKDKYPLERLLALMVKPLRWSEGLPLAAAGWVGPRYGKR